MIATPVGAEAGGDWAVVTAKVTAKYGQSSVEGVTKGTTVTRTMTIRPDHSGWMRANIWTKDYVTSYRRVAPYCGDQLVWRAVYHDKFRNHEARTQKGRVDWSPAD